jgi:hypothetical protein
MVRLMNDKVTASPTKVCASRVALMRPGGLLRFDATLAGAIAQSALLFAASSGRLVYCCGERLCMIRLQLCFAVMTCRCVELVLTIWYLQPCIVGRLAICAIEKDA